MTNSREETCAVALLLHTNSFFSRTRGSAASRRSSTISRPRISLERLSKSNGHAVRQNRHENRRVTVMGVVAGRRTKRPAGENVGLAMRLVLEAGHSDIKRESGKTIDGRMVVPIFQNVRRYQCGRLGGFCAREAAM